MNRCIASVLFAVAAAAVSWASGSVEKSAHEGTPGGRRNLVVFAAASLTEAFRAIGDEFMRDHPAVDVTFSFGGSQQLAQQLMLGASADVFASADSAQMDATVKSGRVEAGAPAVFAHNRLVVVASTRSPKTVRALDDLAQPGVKLVLAAEPVPAGRYTRIFLERAAGDTTFGAAYAREVEANIVSLEENVRAVLNKVALGEADAGVVYATDVAAAPAGSVASIPIPDRLNWVADYPIAPVAGSKFPEIAREFISFVVSQRGATILSRFGFSPADGPHA